MEKIHCPYCGNNDVIKDAGGYVCFSCGRKFAPAATDEVSSLINMASESLRGGDFSKAREYCERAKLSAPDQPQVYLIGLLCDLKVTGMEQLEKVGTPFGDNPNYRKLTVLGSEGLRERLRRYADGGAANDAFSRARKLMLSAASEEDYRDAARLFGSVSEIEDAERLRTECLDKAEIARKDAVYKNAADSMAEGGAENLFHAAEMFGTIPGWRDAGEKRETCLREAEKAAGYGKPANRRVKTAAALAAAAVVLAAILAVVFVLVPMMRNKKAKDRPDKSAETQTEDGDRPEDTDAREKLYEEAVELYEARDLKEAKTAFAKIRGYRDATEYYDSIAAGANKIVRSSTDGKSSVSHEDYFVDGSGRLIRHAYRVLSEENDYFEYTYDDLDRLIKKVRIYPGRDDEVHEYVYDSSGNLIKDVTDADNFREYTYDGSNRLIKEVNHSKDLQSTNEYTYDVDGNLIGKNSENFVGHQSSEAYSYDLSGNMVKKTYTAEYGQNGVTTYTYNQKGELIREIEEHPSGERVQTDYFYDASGNLIKRVFSGAHTGSDEYEYDEAGVLIKHTMTESDGSQSVTEYSDFVYYVEPEKGPVRK